MDSLSLTFIDTYGHTYTVLSTAVIAFEITVSHMALHLVSGKTFVVRYRNPKMECEDDSKDLKELGRLVRDNRFFAIDYRQEFRLTEKLHAEFR